jgi:hypothetical protein
MAPRGRLVQSSFQLAFLARGRRQHVQAQIDNARAGIRRIHNGLG